VAERPVLFAGFLITQLIGFGSLQASLDDPPGFLLVAGSNCCHARKARSSLA
jgi:hypothetical protein